MTKGFRFRGGKVNGGLTGLIVLVFVIISFGLASGCRRESGLIIGYGRALITPPLGTPCALGLDDELVEVFDDLYVRALWLESEGQAILVLAADVIGIAGEDAEEFSSLIEREIGLPRNQILLHSTHTHQTANSRWAVGKLLEPFGLAENFVSSAFKNQIARGLLEASRQARQSAVPCDMAYVEFPVKDIASNRRIPVEGGKVIFRASRPPAELRQKPEGKIDPLLRLVLFRSRKDGSQIGVVNYNCHPSATGGDEGPYASGDFPGIGMAIAEKQRPNLKLIHLTGTAGEINPGKHVLSDSLAPEDRKKDGEQMGSRYAEAILGALGEVKRWSRPTRLEFSRRSFGLTMKKDMPPREEIHKKLARAVEEYRKAKAEGKAKPGHLPGLYEEYALSQSQGGKRITHAAALRVGDVFLAFMPGEIMLKFGEELRAYFGRPKLLNVTLSLDGGLGYVVPLTYFEEGGYEPTVTSLAPDAYNELKTQMISLLKSVS